MDSKPGATRKTVFAIGLGAALIALGGLCAWVMDRTQPELAGTRWTLVEVYGNGQASPPFESGQKISFKSATELAGSDGCNSILGKYVALPNGWLWIIGFKQTLLACIDASGAVSSGYHDFTNALQAATSYKISGSAQAPRLWIYYGLGGSSALIFAPDN